MPRGLGDNPLKREKKLRRSSSRASRAGPSGLTTNQNPTLPAGISGPGDTHASPATTSYNDVFFHRRPEDSTSTATNVPEVIHEETHVEAPADVHPEVPVETAPAVEVTPVEAAPAPVTETVPAAVIDTPAPVAVESIQPVAESPVESAPVPLVESSTEAVVKETPQTLAPVASVEEKKGFFGRIFGKWKKS